MSFKKVSTTAVAGENVYKSFLLQVTVDDTGTIDMPPCKIHASINKREAHFTYRLALIAVSIGTFGPFRISAFSQTGLSIFTCEDFFTKISRDGPTDLMLLKSSLIAVSEGGNPCEIQWIRLAPLNSPHQLF